MSLNQSAAAIRFRFRDLPCSSTNHPALQNMCTQKLGSAGLKPLICLCRRVVPVRWPWSFARICQAPIIVGPAHGERNRTYTAHSSAFRMQVSLEKATLSCQSEPVSVQFHPSEHAVCAGCMDGTVQFYEWKESSRPSEGFLELVEGWEELADEEGGDENVRAVAFVSGGDKVACGTSGGCITLYDSRLGGTSDEVTAEGDVYSLLAVGGGSKVLAAGAEPNSP